MKKYVWDAWLRPNPSTRPHSASPRRPRWPYRRLILPAAIRVRSREMMLFSAFSIDFPASFIRYYDGKISGSPALCFVVINHTAKVMRESGIGAGYEYP